MTERHNVVSNDEILGTFNKYRCQKCGKILEANFKPKIHSGDPKHYCNGKVVLIQSNEKLLKTVCIHDWNDGVVFSDKNIVAKCDLCGALLDNRNQLWLPTPNGKYIMFGQNRPVHMPQQNKEKTV